MPVLILSGKPASSCSALALRSSSREYPAASSIARQRGFVRMNLKTKMKEIDKLVDALLNG
jgi:hypothetical protein